MSWNLRVADSKGNFPCGNWHTLTSLEDCIIQANKYKKGRNFVIRNLETGETLTGKTK